MIDLQLWLQCKRICPPVLPPKLPHFCGTITYKEKQRHIYLVDGNRVKVMDRKGGMNKKGNPEFMDFVEGGNGQEDEELCKGDECMLDARNHRENWPFVCYHEVRESVDMENGDDYDKAHEKANADEKQLRLHYASG